MVYIPAPSDEKAYSDSVIPIEEKKLYSSALHDEKSHLSTFISIEEKMAHAFEYYDEKTCLNLVHSVDERLARATASHNENIRSELLLSIWERNLTEDDVKAIINYAQLYGDLHLLETLNLKHQIPINIIESLFLRDVIKYRSLEHCKLMYSIFELDRVDVYNCWPFMYALMYGASDILKWMIKIFDLSDEMICDIINNTESMIEIDTEDAGPDDYYRTVCWKVTKDGTTESFPVRNYCNKMLHEFVGTLNTCPPAMFRYWRISESTYGETHEQLNDLLEFDDVKSLQDYVKEIGVIGKELSDSNIIQFALEEGKLEIAKYLLNHADGKMLKDVYDIDPSMLSWMISKYAYDCAKWVIEELNLSKVDIQDQMSNLVHVISCDVEGMDMLLWLHERFVLTREDFTSEAVTLLRVCDNGLVTNIDWLLNNVAFDATDFKNYYPAPQEDPAYVEFADEDCVEACRFVVEKFGAENVHPIYSEVASRVSIHIE